MFRLRRKPSWLEEMAAAVLSAAIIVECAKRAQEQARRQAELQRASESREPDQPPD